MNGNELLAGLPTQLGGVLQICECGHLPDEHVGGRCRHLNRASEKRGLPAAACKCRRFQPDPRLTDGEAFVRRILQKVLGREQIPVEVVELEDALSVMFRQLMLTCAKYDSRSHVRFRVYAYLELYNDAIDHFRSERGRHGQHRVFDARLHTAELADLDDGAVGADRLGGAASKDPADDHDAWAADAGGLLAEDDGAPARAAGVDGGGDAPRHARRDPRPVPGTARRARTPRTRSRRGARGRGVDDGGVDGETVEPRP